MQEIGTAQKEGQRRRFQEMWSGGGVFGQRSRQKSHAGAGSGLGPVASLTLSTGSRSGDAHSRTCCRWIKRPVRVERRLRMVQRSELLNETTSSSSSILRSPGGTNGGTGKVEGKLISLGEFLFAHRRVASLFCLSQHLDRERRRRCGSYCRLGLSRTPATSKV